MIAFLPDPHTDELFYSSCARYGEMVKYPSTSIVVQRLFGSKTAAIVDLPKRLEHLLAVLPPNNYTFDRIVGEYTLFRFYAHFLPIERIPRLLERMSHEAGSTLHATLGITNCNLKVPSKLRFCIECVKEDREEFGKTYWHRIHQLPGIDVCPLHALVLTESEAAPNLKSNKSKFFSAESAVFEAGARKLDLNDRCDSLLLKIANEAKWLLEYDGSFLGVTELRKRYHNLLLKQGFAYYNGRIRANKLLASFVEYYPPELLSKLKSEVPNADTCWLFRILARGRPYTIQHPVRNLLLIIFLGQTAREIFTSFSEFKPFGDGPWPCHNRAPGHYGELRVIDCQVFDYLERAATPFGIFNCDCGFAYTRIGPDSDDKDRYRHNRVLSYGPTWERNLKRLWREDAHLRDVAAALGVSKLTVVRHAIRLRLPMNIPGARDVGPKTLERYSNPRPQREDARAIYRKAWIAVRTRHPQASRKQLIGIAPFFYAWLRRYDPHWIEFHLPTPRSHPMRALIDWRAVDEEFAARVITAASRIRGQIGRPVRASKAAIIKEVGHQGWIEGSLHKLPLTEKTLSENLESFESFQIRKVKWAEDTFREEGFCPTKHQLIVKAVVRNKSGRMPRVQEEIGLAMARLESVIL
jgi:hypothetical protein